MHFLVVKLFNAIQQTQMASVAVQEEAKAARGSGKPSLPAPVLDSKTKKKNATALGKSESSEYLELVTHTKRLNTLFHFEALNQDMFLQMIKSGGVVSNS